MIDDGQGRSPPHWLLFPAVFGLVLMFPLMLGDGGEAVMESSSEMLGPIGLLFLPVALILIIRFLSSDMAASAASVIFAPRGGGGVAGDGGGSPFGVVLIIVLVLFLLYSKVSIFGGDGDSE